MTSQNAARPPNCKRVGFAADEHAARMAFLQVSANVQRHTQGRSHALLTHSERARGYVIEIMDAPEGTCRHCGSGPDADGDHSCPCPHRDDDCTLHGPSLRSDR